MNELKLMISFLTRIPVGEIDFSENKFEKSIKYTPIVGIIIGSILAGVCYLLRFIPNKLIIGFLISLIYIFITGGLHLDGLSDSFDGLFSNRDKERILEIMKDSRIGAFGVLSLIFLILGQMIFIGNISVLSVFMFPVIGRCSLFIASNSSKYSRANGMGKTYIEKGKSKACKISFVLVTTFLTILSVIFLEYSNILAMIISYLVAYKATKFAHRKIDGITGDILGMVVEISQLTFIVLSYILLFIF